MKPLKAKDFIPALAETLNYDEGLVKDIVNSYWRDVRKNVSSLKHSRVHLTNLGDLVIKHWKLKEKIDNLVHFEEYNRQRGMQQVTARFKNAELLYDLRTLSTGIEEEQQRKQFIKLHKSVSNEITRQPDQSMESQAADS